MNSLKQYLAELGLPPKASLEQINEAYFSLLEQVGEDETERYQRLQHAYDVLRKAHQQGDEVETKREPVSLRPLLPALVALSVILGGVMLFLYRDNLRTALVRYDVGEVVRWHNQDAAYGEILAYEDEHLFHNGTAAPAYRIKRADTGAEEWIHARLVIKGMRPVEGDAPMPPAAPETETAGSGTAP